jgi:hypothetical protein
MHYFKSVKTLLNTASVGLVTFIAGCMSTPLPSPEPLVTLPEPVATPEPIKPAPVTAAPARPEPVLAKVSHAATPLAYRKDAAHHLYGHNAHRIYQGKMPPLLYAIGVLQVEVDNKGRVTGTHWMRAPSQAPEVVAEIERTVRLAAPFPVPARMGKVTYTDTWLWHSSGHFQLDTLTEGQL